MDLRALSPQARLALVADWIDERLDADTAGQLTAALAYDDALVADVEWVRGLARAAADHPLIEPPPVLRQRLRQNYHRWTRDHAGSGDRVMELPTTLIFDSRRDQLHLQARGAGSESAQLTQLVFRCELADLILDARPAGRHRWSLAGQVVLGHATSSPVFEAQAEGPDEPVVWADGDAFGRFSAEVPDTVNRLTVTNGEITMVAALALRQP